MHSAQVAADLSKTLRVRIKQFIRAPIRRVHAACIALGPVGRRRSSAIAGVGLLVFAACSPLPTPSGPPDSSSSQSEAPTTSDGKTPGPGPTGGIVPVETPPAEAHRGLVLSEVGFRHDSEAAFVELWNAGDESADLREIAVAVDGVAVPVAFPVESLAADARSLVRFDLVFDPVTGVSVDPGSAHASPTAGPAIRGGTVDLLDLYGRPIDHVAWGDEPDAVRTGLAGVVPDTVELAWAIGRAPGAPSADDRLAWIPYGPGAATPGGPNPLPAVPVLLPLNGAVFDKPTADLSWYPAPGATGYRVQVATDEGFATIVRDEAVTDIGLDIEELVPGSYWWRVQATGDGGLAAAFAGPASFEVVGATAGISTAVAGIGGTSAVLAATTAVEPDAVKRLTVPLLKQAKDSPLLLLERNVRTGPHPWDEPHGDLDRTDPSDYANCALASTAMLAAFACPNCRMSQDRIGYELFHGRLPGPERDFNYGDGLTDGEILRAIEFALVASNPRILYEEVPDRVWAALRAQIDLGRPVVVSRSTGPGTAHAFVITGYSVVAGRRTVYANDPWSGLKQYRIADSAEARPADWWKIFPTSGPLLGRQQELSVTTDSDGDGVMDFDETERFHTDPERIDSDVDGVGDKEDVAYSIFDPVYGYAVHFNLGAGYYFGDRILSRTDLRDWDDDGLPNERDPDSDQGGCKDGDEDADLLGDHDPDETWSYDTGDDPCRPVHGTLTWTSNSAVGSTESWGRVDQRLEVSVQMKPNPEWAGSFLNDGSGYHYVGRGRGYTVGLAGCDTFYDVVRSGGGTLAADDLAGNISVEHEPGRDAFVVTVSAPWQGRGRRWDCMSEEPLSEQDVFSPESECWAFENTDDGSPERTFVFDCRAEVGVGWFGHSWTLTGTITIR